MDAEHVKIPVGISSCLLGERVRYDGSPRKHYREYGTGYSFSHSHRGTDSGWRSDQPAVFFCLSVW